MGLGLMSRLTQGLSNMARTMATGEAYLSKPKEVAEPKISGDFGILRFGTQFKDMGTKLNPFLSSVRPATGPTVARPEQAELKSSGGAFAPQMGMQISSGMNGLSDPINSLSSLVQMAQSQQMGTSDVAKIAADAQKLLVMQKAMDQVSEMVKMISQCMKAAHEAAMNSIRNLRG